MNSSYLPLTLRFKRLAVCRSHPERMEWAGCGCSFWMTMASADFSYSGNNVFLLALPTHILDHSGPSSAKEQQKCLFHLPSSSTPLGGCRSFVVQAHLIHNSPRMFFLL